MRSKQSQFSALEPWEMASLMLQRGPVHDVLLCDVAQNLLDRGLATGLRRTWPER